MTGETVADTTDTTDTTSGGSADSGDTSTSGDPVPPPCLPTELRGPLFANIAGWNIYDAVDSNGYMVERPGAEVLDPDALKTIFDTYPLNPLFDEVPGVVATGYGLCLSPVFEPKNSAICLIADLATHTSTVEALTQALAVIFADAPEGCFGVSVDFLGLLEPRCDVGDPECEPLPKCPGCSYAPEAPRTPAGWNNQEGTCAHDGDCFLNGCSNHCDAWTVPGYIGFCTAEPGACANCGCVEGLCQWFTQDIDDPKTCW